MPCLRCRLSGHELKRLSEAEQNTLAFDLPSAAWMPQTNTNDAYTRAHSLRPFLKNREKYIPKFEDLKNQKLMILEIIFVH